MAKNRIEILIEGSATRDFGYLVVNDATRQVELHRFKIAGSNDVEVLKARIKEKYVGHPILDFA